MLLDIAPNGQSYILAINEYCQRHFRTDVIYVYRQCEPASYAVTTILDGLTYATELSTNKLVAKIMAARSTAEVLLPEFRSVYFDKTLSESFKLSIFDNVDLADERIPEITMPYDIIKPYKILLQCLDRNFGYKEKDIEFMTYAGSPFANGRLTMSVGSYRVSVPMSRFAKQEASQSILMNVHPHLESWGSLIRMYIVNDAANFLTMAFYLERAQNIESDDESELENDVVPQEAAGEDKGEPRTAFRDRPGDSETDSDDDGDNEQDNLLGPDDNDEDDAQESSLDSDEEAEEDEEDEVPISILYGADYRDELDEIEGWVAKDASALMLPLREINYCLTPLYQKIGSADLTRLYEHSHDKPIGSSGHSLHNPSAECSATTTPWCIHNPMMNSNQLFSHNIMYPATSFHAKRNLTVDLYKPDSLKSSAQVNMRTSIGQSPTRKVQLPDQSHCQGQVWDSIMVEFPDKRTSDCHMIQDNQPTLSMHHSAFNYKDHSEPTRMAVGAWNRPAGITLYHHSKTHHSWKTPPAEEFNLSSGALTSLASFQAHCMKPLSSTTTFRSDMNIWSVVLADASLALPQFSTVASCNPGISSSVHEANTRSQTSSLTNESTSNYFYEESVETSQPTATPNQRNELCSDIMGNSIASAIQPSDVLTIQSKAAEATPPAPSYRSRAQGRPTVPVPLTRQPVGTVASLAHLCSSQTASENDAWSRLSIDHTWDYEPAIWSPANPLKLVIDDTSPKNCLDTCTAEISLLSTQNTHNEERLVSRNSNNGIPCRFMPQFVKNLLASPKCICSQHQPLDRHFEDQCESRKNNKTIQDMMKNLKLN